MTNLGSFFLFKRHRARLFGVCFCLMFLLQPLSALQQTWTLENGSKALVYFPKSFNKYRSTPVIMALHGMSEYTQPTMDRWKPIAEAYGYIIITPIGNNFSQGFSRSPIDDRKDFVSFFELLKKHYRIDTKKSILAGFSRGGNYAMETGILYPETFPNVICIFGFFTDVNKANLEKNYTPKKYKKSKFMIISSKGDFTEKSSKLAVDTLTSYSIPAKLNLEKDLYHAYPPGFTEYFRTMYTWFF